MVDVELHPHGIIPIYKEMYNFVSKKLNFFFLQFFFLYLIYSLGGYNRNKSNFKKVGAIPCGCNTNGTHYYYHIQTEREKKIREKDYEKEGYKRQRSKEIKKEIETKEKTRDIGKEREIQKELRD